MTVEEAFESGTLGSGADRRGEKRYIVFDVDLTSGDDEADIVTAVEAAAPTTFAGMARRGVQVSPISNTIWAATVTYTPSELLPPPEHNEYLLSFSTNGQTEEVFTAINQYEYQLQGEAGPPPMNKAINVDDEGNVAGVTITVPTFRFSETHYKADSAMTTSYLGTLTAATGKVNDDAFRGFSAGEVLFLGVSGQKRGREGDWELTFEFVASPNRTLTPSDLGGDITLTGSSYDIDKGGHQYLWVKYTPAQEFGTKRVITKPLAAYVATVYGTADFDTLALSSTQG